MRARDLLEGCWMEGPAAQLVAALAGKTPWLLTVLKA
jgi:hypothetical protein